MEEKELVERRCFICGSEKQCSHREPDVEDAELTRRVNLLRELPRKPAGRAETLHAERRSA